MVTLAVKPIPISEKQQQIVEANEWLTGLVGGRGSGKTRIGPIKISQTAKHEDPFLAISPDANVVRETTFPTFLEVVEQTGQLARYVTSPTPKIWFRTLDGGIANIIFKGAEKPDKLRGPNKAGVWFDEASVISKEAFEIAIACCRWRGKMGQVLCTFTPRGFRHWTFEQFFEPIDEAQAAKLNGKVKWFRGRPFVAREDTRLVKCATRDNPFAPANFVERIGRNYSSMLAQQELEGDYVEISGLMFRHEFFRFVDEAPRDAVRIRYWDRAATPGGGCYTAGVLMARASNGLFLRRACCSRPVERLRTQPDHRTNCRA